MRTSTIVMIAFAVVFGLLAVFLANAWLNNRAAEQMRNLAARQKAVAPAHTIVVATRPLHFGEVLNASSLREIPWPENAVPAGAFSRIGDLTASKHVVLAAIAANEPVLASRITGPGQRATLSARLHDGMRAVAIRVNDVVGVAGFVLPGEHVDVVVSRQINPKSPQKVNDVLIQNARVLAVDQLADETSDKPALARTVTLEVNETDAQKLVLASSMGGSASLSLLLRKAGDIAKEQSQRVSATDLRSGQSSFATVVVLRPADGGMAQDEYSVPSERGHTPVASVAGRLVAHE